MDLIDLFLKGLKPCLIEIIFNSPVINGGAIKIFYLFYYC
jgi:hypothetical protein